jgi:hypothetical protein
VVIHRVHAGCGRGDAASPAYGGFTVERRFVTPKLELIYT